MRVVHVIGSLYCGGAERMLQRLIEHDQQAEHIVVCLRDLGTIGPFLLNSNIPIFTLHLSLLNTPHSFNRLILILKCLKPDVVQTWLYHADLFGGLAAKVAGVPLIFWNIRNNQVPQHPLSLTGLIIGLCSLLSHSIPTRIVTCAQSARSRHISLGYASDKFTVIPNGFVPHEDFRDLESFRDAKQTTIGFAGRYDYLKGFDIFIEAAAYLKNRSTTDIIFMCAGRNIDYSNQQIVRHLRSRNLLESFILLGELASLDFFYNSIDIFCLPSRSEGFSNVLAEAMLHSIPCIATDVGDSSLILANKALIVTPSDPKALAEAILKVIHLSKYERHALGTELSKRIKTDFSISKIVMSYISLYNYSLDKLTNKNLPRSIEVSINA